MHTEHVNFYFIEIKNEGLRSIFSEDHNLRFFLAASQEFGDDIETINATDGIVDSIIKNVGTNVLKIDRFNPNFFPTLDSSYHIGMEDLEESSAMLPGLSKTTLVMLNNEQIVNAKSICRTNAVISKEMVNFQ